MRSRLTLLSAAFGLACAAPAFATGPAAPVVPAMPMPVLNASCVGGVAGVYRLAAVTPDGVITTPTGWGPDAPWAVATSVSPERATRWFEDALQAPLLVPSVPGGSMALDAITCTLTLTENGVTRSLDADHIRREIHDAVPW